MTTYLRNPDYNEDQAQHNPYYQRTPYILAVKQLPNGFYGIGKVTSMHGKKITAWEWVHKIDRGQPHQFSNTYRATREKAKLEYSTLHHSRHWWGVE